MARALIGIGTSYREEVQRQRRTYGDAVVAAGGLPVLLGLANVEGVGIELCERLDGLVIPGGPAITRGMSGSLPGNLEETPRDRVLFDERMAAAFVASNKPVLGICYGMQLLNALGGGTIYADVEKELSGALVHSQKRGADRHPIRITPESTLARVLGTTQMTVNTRHVQAVRDVSSLYLVSARAPDGVVEAIESPDGRILGVQFHPELMGDAGLPLFRHLVERAAARRFTSVPALPESDTCL